MMHGNSLLIYVHNCGKAGNITGLYSFLVFLSMCLIYNICHAQWISVELSQALLVWGEFPACYCDVTESEKRGTRQRTQSRKKLRGLWDPGGKQIFTESLTRENTVSGIMNLRLKKERKWWEIMMFGGKSVCVEGRAWIGAFDRNRAFRNQDGARWGGEAELAGRGGIPGAAGENINSVGRGRE